MNQAPVQAPFQAPELGGKLRQMIAALEQERQALATLDAGGLTQAAERKQELCDLLAPFGPEDIDTPTRDLVETAKALNEVNRRVRNLLAANVANRLEALGDVRAAYSAPNPMSA